MPGASADPMRGAPLLADPAVRTALAATFVGMLSAGIAPVGLVLLCRDAGLSYGQVGQVFAGYAAGLLLGGPWRGRAVDRRGQRVAIVGLALAHTVALAALLVVVRSAAPVVAIAAVAALASATFPPYGAVLRDRWTVLLPDPLTRRRGFSAQAIQQEAVFVVGPMVATATAALAGPDAVVPVMVVLTGAGSAAIVRGAPPHHRPEDRPRHGWLGALAAPGVRVVVLAHVPMGLALGALDITAVAFAEDTARRALAGLLVTSFSLGSVLGGIAWSRRGGSDAPRVFPLLAGVFLVLQLPLLVVASFLPALALFAIAGLAFAPLVATVYALIDRVALEGTTAEATTWLSTAMGLGSIVGSAGAGALIDRGAATHGFLLNAAGAVLILTVAVGGARWLRAPAPAPGA